MLSLFRISGIWTDFGKNIQKCTLQVFSTKIFRRVFSSFVSYRICSSLTVLYPKMFSKIIRLGLLWYIIYGIYDIPYMIYRIWYTVYMIYRIYSTMNGTVYALQSDIAQFESEIVGLQKVKFIAFLSCSISQMFYWNKIKVILNILLNHFFHKFIRRLSLYWNRRYPRESNLFRAVTPAINHSQSVVGIFMTYCRRV